MPHDFPPNQSVYGYFARWEADGIFDQLTGLLRGKVRQAEGRSSEPRASHFSVIARLGCSRAGHLIGTAAGPTIWVVIS
ncbi:transposase [Streptomyces sp. NBS 14/10]|uniref:transposase n=1 Tax=Streptomyces sp. NBS 14/10 TaxID=1945643 RepID=UPI00211B5F37|nr:transposase [Streptomyces sp. NBS 14/10]KAK1185852.1 transposase [Streptomyces sp. NBS 14/10]